MSPCFSPAHVLQAPHDDAPCPRSVVVIQERVGDQGLHSGYDQLVGPLSELVKVRTISPPGCRPRMLPGRLWATIAARSGSAWYGSTALSLEAQAASEMLRSRSVVFHIIYGENDYRYLGYMARAMRRRGMRVVATFHQPPAVFDMVYPGCSALRYLDGAVCLSRAQMSFFQAFLPQSTFFVRHGVDVAFFSPAPNVAPPRPTCLFIGQWLRDFDTLRSVAEGLRHRSPGAVITAVMPAKHHDRFSGLQNVICRQNLTDEELRDAYREASLLLLPLTDATANNALLEAISCGLPAVVTETGGVRDYVDDSCAYLTPPGDVAAIVDAVTNLLRDESLRVEKGLNARTRALRYSWQHVAAELLDVYRRL